MVIIYFLLMKFMKSSIKQILFSHMFPENVLKVVRKFADDVVNSLQFALKTVPDNLTYVKIKCKYEGSSNRLLTLSDFSMVLTLTLY